MSKYVTVVVLSVTLVLIMVASSPALFFDFNDPKQLDSWEVLNDAGGTWEIVDGTLKITAAGARWDFLTIKGIEFTDGTIQYKLKWLSGTYCEVGAAYRIQEAPDFANYQIHISTVEPALRWGYCMAAAGGGTWGPELPRPAVKGWGQQPVDEWFEFKIEVEGDNHVTYAGLEGEMEKVAEVSQGDLKEGKIGLVSYSGMAEETLIDDFEVTGPGIQSAVESYGKLSTTWSNIKTLY